MPTPEKRGLMRSLNDGIALFAVDAPTAAGETPETWAFVCECGAAECDAWVDLDLAEYAAIRADPDMTILAAGHIAPSAAQRAQRKDTRALHAEAKLQ